MWFLFHVIYFVGGCTYLVRSQDIMTNSIGDEMVINKVVDELLTYVRIAIVDEGMDRIAIPDLNAEFIGPLDVKAQFRATNGTAAYLRTVKRTGDAKINYQKEITTLSLDLGLSQLVVDYSHYDAQILSVGPTGQMQATIGHNSIYTSFYLHYSLRKCDEDLGVLYMDQFDDINVNLTGLYPLDWLLDDLAVWIANDFRNNIKYLIEDNLRKAVRSAMGKYNICKFLPHLPTS